MDTKLLIIMMMIMNNNFQNSQSILSGVIKISDYNDNQYNINFKSEKDLRAILENGLFVHDISIHNDDIPEVLSILKKIDSNINFDDKLIIKLKNRIKSSDDTIDGVLEFNNEPLFQDESEDTDSYRQPISSMPEFRFEDVRRV